MRRLVSALRHPADYSWWELRPWRRHSLVLAVAGVIHVLIGVAYLATPTNPVRSATLTVPLSLAPMPVWCGVFGLVGALALVSARWPPASEGWGYSAMSGVAALWAAFNVWGVLITGETAGFTSALIWSVLAFLWWAIAGLVNPENVPLPEEPGDE